MSQMSNITKQKNGLSWTALMISLIAIALPASQQGLFNSSPRAVGEGHELSSFVRDGILRVALVPAPPITSIDPASRKPDGYAVDVTNAIASKAKLRVEYLPTDWATMGAALSSRKADLVIGPIFVTEGRAKEYLFTESIFAYAVVAVVPTQGSKVARLADLQAPGLRIAVGRGGFDSEFVGNRMPLAAVSAFPPDDPNLPMLEVVARRADVALADYATAVRFVAEHPGVMIGLGGEPLVSGSFAVYRP